MRRTLLALLFFVGFGRDLDGNGAGEISLLVNVLFLLVARSIM